MARGKFIVFEGGEGSGKDTQIELLREKLSPKEYLFVRDPGTTEVGMKVREMLLHDDTIVKEAEMLMYLGVRVQLAVERVKPAIESGMDVISNRFSLSTIAYQIYGRERMEWLPLLTQMSDFALGGMKPDITILLDCPPQVGLERAGKIKHLDRFESEQLPFHERVRKGYLTHITDYPEHYILDATKSIEEVHEEVMKIIVRK